MHFSSYGIPVAPSYEVTDLEKLKSICQKGLPVMLKSRRMAYDGRGNAVIRTMDDIEPAIKSLGGLASRLYVEEWANYTKELAVIVARSMHGEIRSYPVAETVHKDSICFVTETPAAVDSTILEKARLLAERTVASLDGAGVYGVEMFLLENGEVLINEIAPRPHNSGHYTIDGCSISQFEQHIRAVLGWPLGDTSLTVDSSNSVTDTVQVGNAIMLNILGEEDGVEGLARARSLVGKALQLPGTLIHWYEKSGVSKNRKIGHINLVGQTREQTLNRLKELSTEAYEYLTQDDPQRAQPSQRLAQVSVIMGSDSDLPTMKPACEILEAFGISTEVTVVSAHRTPERMMHFAKTAHERGIRVIIAGAGGAAHLPGMVASLTPLPVIGVPCVPNGSHLDGMDALLSIVQMPRGVPVATVGVGNAANAGLLAARMLGMTNPDLMKRLQTHQAEMKEIVMQQAERLESQGWQSY